MNDALVNARVCDTGACSSSSRPLSHSSAVMKVQHSSSSFSFTVLFSYKACMLKSSQEERKPKEPKQKAKPPFQTGGKQRDGPYTAATCPSHSLIIPETSCKHACWKRPAETEQLIWKKAEFSSVQCGRVTRQLHTSRALYATSSRARRLPPPWHEFYQREMI